MNPRSLNRVPVTLIPAHREILQERAKLSGLPVATLAALLLRRAIEEIRTDDGLFFRVLMGKPDDPQDAAAALSVSQAVIAGMERDGKPQIETPASERPRAPRRLPKPGKARPAKKAGKAARKRAAR